MNPTSVLGLLEDLNPSEDILYINSTRYQVLKFVCNQSRFNFTATCCYYQGDELKWKNIFIIKDGELVAEKLYIEDPMDHTVSEINLRDLPLVEPIEVTPEMIVECILQEDEASQYTKAYNQIVKSYKNKSEKSSKEETTEEPVADTTEVVEESESKEVQCVTYQIKSGDLCTIDLNSIQETCQSLDEAKDLYNEYKSRRDKLRFKLRSHVFTLESTESVKSLPWTPKAPLPRSKKKFFEDLSVPIGDCGYLLRRISWTESIKI